MVFDISTLLNFQHPIPFSPLFGSGQLFIKIFGFGNFLYIPGVIYEKQIFGSRVILFYHPLLNGLSTVCQPFFITLLTIFSAIER